LSHYKQRKFVLPVQGGFDGFNPAKAKNVGNDISATNTQGFNLSTGTASGSIAYKRALNAISNPDEFDINMIVTPGVIHEYHPSITNKAIDVAEARADAFYVMDGSRWGRSVDNAIQDIKALDTNYAATYYPWVKIQDINTNKPSCITSGNCKY
jgi:phage tail sheath protein FI